MSATMSHGFSLLLGGGYGYLTGQHGMAVDNLLQVRPVPAGSYSFLLTGLLQATIVTADGSTLTLSETENPDLFWAIRGGGSNFGVCTEFIIRLHPQRATVFAGLVIFPPDVLDALMATIHQWWANVKDNEVLVQILGRDPAGRVSNQYHTNATAAAYNIFAGLHNAFPIL